MFGPAAARQDPELAALLRRQDEINGMHSGAKPPESMVDVGPEIVDMLEFVTDAKYAGGAWPSEAVLRALIARGKRAV